MHGYIHIYIYTYMDACLGVLGDHRLPDVIGTVAAHLPKQLPVSPPKRVWPVFLLGRESVYEWTYG